ncbi:MAG: endonuclease/exonuclease/phosphatase family protein [Ignavibacteriales bacterium]|nr:MAG: endonuclease/exonuclease/phosphatase family protein [Ignavibacteriales bacterium]
MQRRTLLFMVLFITIISDRSFVLAQNDSIVIATFNCEFLNKDKIHVRYGLPLNINQASDAQKQQWSQPGFRDQKFLESTELVAQVLVQLRADVLALTEVGEEADVELLRTELNSLGMNYPHKAVCISSDNTTNQHVAVISRFPLSEVLQQIPGREYYLPETDDPETETHTGVSKGMRVTFTAFNKDFILYVLHLASERGGYAEDQQRISQASIVRRHYLDDLRDGKNIIVTGDLNDYRGQPTLLRLRGIDDIYDDLIQTGHKDFFDQSLLNTRWTYEFEGIRQQIDHILISFSIKDICKSSGGIRARTYEHFTSASDHLPFIVTLKLK